MRAAKEVCVFSVKVRWVEVNGGGEIEAVFTFCEVVEVKPGGTQTGSTVAAPVIGQPYAAALGGARLDELYSYTLLYNLVS